MSDPYLSKRFGSVRLIKKLGQGSMGMVYHGYHEAFATDVAVKILKPVNNEAKEQFYQRFLREGRAAARVRDENVVQVMDAGHENGVAYLVLEFVQGASLGEILDKKGTIDQKTVMSLGEQIAKGMAAIHKEEIIHRDIKPDNILLGKGGIIKIADLGLAKEMDQESVNRLTMSGMVVGTPYYISPEAINDVTNAKPSADVYSFGASMYHLLTGRPPFDGNSAYEVMRAHLENRFQPLREIDRNINPNLANLIERCLDKNPNNRPSAKEIANIIGRGGRVQSGARGISFLAAFIVAIIGSLALIMWKMLPQQQDDLIIGENAANISILSSHQHSEIKINRQKWRALNGKLTIASGKHSIVVRSYEDGILMHWQTELDVGNDPIELSAQLKSVPIKAVTISLNEESAITGLVFKNGRCLGRESHLRFDKAGVYEIAVWQKNNQWRQRRYTIDINGDVTSSSWSQTDQVPLDAYLQGFVEQEKTEAHHVISWFEAEQIRQQQNVLEPAGWSEQALQGHQFAQHLTPPLVTAINEWAQQQGLRMLNDTEVTRFKQYYSGSLWHRERHHYRVLGRTSSAMLILVPVSSK